MTGYNHKKIERKWQKEWEKKKIYQTKDPSSRAKLATGRTRKKEKFYVLDMFPYPSGEGLHVGHPKGYIATDVISRMRRMQGRNVLHPMGFDAFGLPAENFAIKKKIHPEVAVKKNIKRFKEQLGLIGLDYDWSREVITTDPKYYKWTQWIFLQLFKKGLAYESHEPINWCPSCKTGLANEDVEGGRCERCGTIVEKRPLRQWVLKITDYADRLLKDLDIKKPDGSPLLEWPEAIKEMQRNWIGRSEGINLKCKVKGLDIYFEAYDSVPQTFMAQTFTVIAPDHPKLKELVKGTPKEKEVLTYAAKMLAERARLGVDYVKKVDGIFTERFLKYEPARRDLPIWVASYALMDYGSGVVNCSAHDERDFIFAKKFNIPLHLVAEALDIDNPDPTISFVERNAISAIVKHWREDKYLALKWKDAPWITFVTGGVEAGEAPEEAARHEIKEETGFVNLKLVKVLPKSHSKFYHVQKKENRFAHFSNFYFELENGEGVEPDEIEGKAKHDVIWLKPEEVEKMITTVGQKRDFEIIQGKEKPIVKNGILMEPKEFKGREWHEVREDIIDYIVKKGWGKRKVNYKLRDWVFSRQRYWGEPIPIIHCTNCGVVPVPERELPVKLPKVKFYEPTGTGESPLAGISKWVNVKCPKCKGLAKRETNTMPQWAGSSWYYLRYMNPKNTKALVDKKKEKYWNMVDLYVGGAEHATRHLIYARFWHKFLFDIEAVSTMEPFGRLQSVGLIMGSDGRKMSKRFGNVINPDDVVKTYGADTLRLYEMFMGPFDQAIAWSEEAIIGPRRFLERVWKMGTLVTSQKQENLPALPASGLRHGSNFSAFALPEIQTNFAARKSHPEGEGSSAQNLFVSKLLHKTIKKVGEDIELMHFNTAISALMIFINEAERGSISRDDYKKFLQILAPFAPHIAEELWVMLGEKKSVHLSTWPSFDLSLIVDEEIKIALQVNGKVRAEIVVSADDTEDDIKKKALSSSAAERYLGGKSPKKLIYVKGRLINIVT